MTTRRWATVLGTIAAVGLLAVVVLGLVRSSPGSVDRAEALGRTIRCPVCQAESIADSPSVTAQEMMAIVRDQIAEGRSDEEIRAWFVQRYGRFVVLDPAVAPDTALLWFAPLVAVGVGAIAVRRLTSGDDRPASPDEVDELRRRLREMRDRETDEGAADLDAGVNGS